MAIEKVGTAQVFNGPVSMPTDVGQDIAITPTAGNCIVIIAYIDALPASVTCSTVGGSATFTTVASQYGTGSTMQVIVATNVLDDITAINVLPTGSGWGQVWMQEFSGVDNSTPMDTTALTGSFNNTTSVQAPSITPVTVGALVIDAVGSKTISNTSSPYPATASGPTSVSGKMAGLGWTAESDFWNTKTGNTTSANLSVGSNLVDALGAYQAGWVLAATPFAGSTVTAIALRPYVPVENAFFTVL